MFSACFIPSSKKKLKVARTVMMKALFTALGLKVKMMTYKRKNKAVQKGNRMKL